MNLKYSFLSIFYIVSLIVILSPSNIDASFFDGIPFVSQVKSLIQLIANEPDAARQTQENFLNQAPVVSQVKSGIEFISGNSDAALRTQKNFLSEFRCKLLKTINYIESMQFKSHLQVKLWSHSSTIHL